MPEAYSYMIPNPSPRKRKLTRRSFLKKAALTVLGTMAIPQPPSLTPVTPSRNGLTSYA